MAKRIRQLPTYIGATTEGDSTSDEEQQLEPRWRKLMKSGMHRTRETVVLNKVTWPHEVVYTSVNKPATYEDISIPLFVQGYIITMEGEEGPIRQKMATHLKELMSDAWWWVCFLGTVTSKAAGVVSSRDICATSGESSIRVR